MRATGVPEPFPSDGAGRAGGTRAELEELSCRAVEIAAADLGLDPLLFARELAQGEVGLLISYLRAAAGHVEDLELRVRIDHLLHRLTEWTEDAASGEDQPLRSSERA
jgi:hypothetical protein